MNGRYIDIAYFCAVIVAVGLIWMFVANIIEDRNEHKRGKYRQK